MPHGPSHRAPPRLYFGARQQQPQFDTLRCRWRAIHSIKSCHRGTFFEDVLHWHRAPGLGADSPHGGVPEDRILGDACLAIAHAHSNSHCGGTIRRVLDELAADDVLDTAYKWLCKRRRDYPPDADIWSFRYRWGEEKATIKTALFKGTYRFGLLTRDGCLDVSP